MGDKPIWEQIGFSFIQRYDQLFTNDRIQLGAIYTDASYLRWEGQQFQGKAAIVEMLSSIPFQKIQHSITAQDHQPIPDSCIISMVVGQLKDEEELAPTFRTLFCGTGTWTWSLMQASGAETVDAWTEGQLEELWHVNPSNNIYDSFI
ncbi:nuclear transport factor 2-like [Arvicanthis niloticus]|uniref:nuclear transport factor 2-like n=1 Tax=Arvicanthis niloticus TaxID=61156 RepID=UPI0014874E7E|nr:nuclear transport factor 2-like [Arvicanthis niloticus]